MVLSPRVRGSLFLVYLSLSFYMPTKKVGKEFTGNILHVLKRKFKAEYCICTRILTAILLKKFNGV